MVMKIKFRHVFLKGEHNVRITGFKVMQKDVLPKEYTASKSAPTCYAQTICEKTYLFVLAVDESGLVRFNQFTQGSVISLVAKEWLEETMKAAGDRLCAINRKNKEKAARQQYTKNKVLWEGKIEVVKF